VNNSKSTRIVYYVSRPLKWITFPAVSFGLSNIPLCFSR